VKEVTEAEWETCPHTGQLLSFVRDRLGARKLHLLGCASVRQVWPALDSPGMRQAVEAGERYADNELTDAELDAAGTAAWRAMDQQDLAAFAAIACTRAATVAVWQAVMHAGVAAARAAIQAAAGSGLATQAAAAAWRPHAALVRCVCGNPFRPLVLPPAVLAWRDGLLVSAARRMYESRDFTEMPVLADMLEDAGCGDAQVLGHCRGPGPHARGCFVVDLLTGRM
jgi:hypothetical protein